MRESLRSAGHALQVAALALILFAGALLAAGESPLHLLLALLRGAFGSRADLARTLAGATPLIFTGLAVAIPFRAGLFNIGAEGQMILAAFGAGAVGAWCTGLPPVLLLPACAAAALAVGSLWAGIAGFLRGRLGIHEVIATILLNFLAVHLAAYLLRAEGLHLLLGQEPKSPALPDGVRLGEIVPGSGVGTALVGAVLLAAAAEFLLFRTRPGLALRALGGNPRAAEAAGISPPRVILLSLVLGGALAALAGLQQVLAVHGSYLEGFSPGFGFTGIAVALLGANRPLGVVFAAFFFAVLRSGAFAMDALAGVPREGMRLVEVMVILLVAAERLRSRPAPSGDEPEEGT